MTPVKTLEGQLNASGIRFAIVAARFNDFIVQHLITGAIDTIIRHGGKSSDITLARVPGSLEIPLICKTMAQSGAVDVVIALGAVIRGATSHYEVVCNETARGVAQVALETGIPVIFGVLTTDTIEQAIERSGTKAGNKGADAALAAVEMVNLLRLTSKDK